MSGASGASGSGMGAVAVDRGRDLDDGVVGQIGEGAAVADVDDLDVAGAVVQ